MLSDPIKLPVLPAGRYDIIPDEHPAGKRGADEIAASAVTFCLPAVEGERQVAALARRGHRGEHALPDAEGDELRAKIGHLRLPGRI